MEKDHEHTYDFEHGHDSINGYKIFFCTHDGCKDKLILSPEEYSGEEYIKDLKRTYYNQ
jgi:hypothetical protein